MRIRTGRATEVLRIKAAVRRRDGGCVTCRITNEEHRRKTGRQLDVHREVPGSVYTVEGCKAYCRECHPLEVKRPRGSVDMEIPNQTQTYRLPAVLVRRIRRVAAHRRLSVSVFLSEALGPLVDRDEAVMVGSPPRRTPARRATTYTA